MDSTKARPFIERILRSPARHRAPGFVIGEFKRINFMRREITVRHLQTGRDLSGVYNDYVEDALLENPRATILVAGTITRNAQGRPISIDNVDRIEVVDVDPVVIREFLADNTRIEATEEVTAVIAFDEHDAVFTAEIASLRLSVHAATRDLLTDALMDELALLWKRYAKAADHKLTPAARVLKKRILAAFREGKNAN